MVRPIPSTSLGESLAIEKSLCSKGHLPGPLLNTTEPTTDPDLSVVKL